MRKFFCLAAAAFCGTAVLLQAVMLVHKPTDDTLIRAVVMCMNLFFALSLYDEATRGRP